MNAFDFGRALHKTAAGSIFSNYQQRKDLANSAMQKLTQPAAAPAAPAAQPGGWLPGPVGNWLPSPGAPAAGAAPGAPRPGVFGNRPSFNMQQQTALDAARARQRAMTQGQ